MIDAYFRGVEETIASFPLVLSSISQFEKIDINSGFLKIKLVFIDQSQLHIFEYVEIKNKSLVEKYRYHWQDKSSKLIKRWDNAPHHPAIEGFPHHLHDREIVKSSVQLNIKQILDIISKEIVK